MNEHIVRTDPRVQRSRASIVAALVELVEQEPLGQLSISRVVEAAGVTRPTFYQHFPDVVSAAQSTAFERLARAFPIPDEAGGALLDDAQLHARIVDHATPVLQHLAGHLTFYRRVLASAIGVEFFDNLVSFVASRLLPEVTHAPDGPDEIRQDLTTVISAGVTWLVIRWLTTGHLNQATAPALAIQAADVVLSLKLRQA